MTSNPATYFFKLIRKKLLYCTVLNKKKEINYSFVIAYWGFFCFIPISLGTKMYFM